MTEQQAQSNPTPLWVKIVGPLVVVLFVIGLIAGRGDGGRDDDGNLNEVHRDMVDSLARQGDCAALQARFDDAADAGGSENTALMEYADAAMERIGCYD